MINIFKKTILLQAFLFFSMLILFIIEDAYFPYKEVDPDFTMLEGVFSISLIVLIPFMWYFLYKLKPIGKKLFIFYLFLGAISYLVFTGDTYILKTVTPVTPFLEFSENALILLDGVILAFLFFTEVKDKFK